MALSRAWSARSFRVFRSAAATSHEGVRGRSVAVYAGHQKSIDSRTGKIMKFSTRAGVLLFAFGAAAASMQSLASAVEHTPAQMVAGEAALEQATVPVNAPVGDVLRQTSAPVPGPSLSG